ncbi:MAG: hypothetical protein Ta2D_14180 [Rickettsiales bacterium]|nr:MAG: hypothetical protein Ta2D_14180 [Rickettsiales bacterium]
MQINFCKKYQKTIENKKFNNNIENMNGNNISNNSNNIDKNNADFLKQENNNKINNILQASKTGNHITESLGTISPELKNLLNRNGINVDDKTEHVINSHVVKHIDKRHGIGNEKKHSQIPIDVNRDMNKIPDIINNADEIQLIKNQNDKHLYSLRYLKQDEQNKIIYYVEAVKKDKKDEKTGEIKSWLESNTMWQKKYSTDFEAKRLLTQKPMPCIDSISKNN